jgi:aldose 1-epimerase
MTSALELRAGALRLAVRPDLGGCIAGLWLNDLPVMRSTEPASLERSRLSSCYPLVPYSGRLGYRRFRWNHQDHTTAANFDDSPHSVHGLAWLRPWSVQRHDAGQIDLALAHGPDADWPFAFAVQQRMVLSESALELHFSFTNTDAQAQPVGLGWHPYFPKRSRSRLHVELTDRWADDATQLPTRRVPQPGIDGDVAPMAFDHCFEGWRGPARIRDEKVSLRLTSSLPYLVVFTPQHRDYFCVEPVSHVPNAIHMADPAAHGLRTLQPGQTWDAWMRLQVDAV